MVKMAPPHSHSEFCHGPLLIVNLFFCVCLSEMCVYVLICANTCLLFEFSHGRGPFSIIDMEMYAVRLIYRVTFTRMMKQSLALSIYRHTQPYTPINMPHAHRRTTAPCLCALFNAQMAEVHINFCWNHHKPHTHTQEEHAMVAPPVLEIF